MDFDGLKTALIEMLSGTSVKLNTATFTNDTVNFKNRDDMLTYLIHLGYLSYNQDERTAFVPNEKIRQELLNATLDMDCSKVAKQIEKIHTEYVSAIHYNNESSLGSVTAIAYLSAMQYYFKPVREMPTGRGFADFVFMPKPEYRNGYPALVVELKWNKTADTALQQIKDKKYPESLLGYAGNIFLVGINYDKEKKEHQCVIEKYQKQE